MVAVMASAKVRKDFAYASRAQRGEHLTRREAQILDYLASHEGRFVPSSEIVEALWHGFAHIANVTVHIQHIREKLGADVIETWHGAGYRMALGTADQLTWRCGRCGAAIVDYGQDWQCYGCGASGDRPGMRDTGPSRVLECAFCGREFRRALSDQEYERRRSPGARVFCSLSCAAKQRWADGGSGAVVQRGKQS